RLRRRQGHKKGGRSRRAASLRSRPTTTTPAVKARLKNGNLVYPPSTTTHSVFPACFTSLASHSKRSAASSSLVWNFQFRFLGIVGNVLRRTYNMARNGKANAPHNGCRRAREIVTQMCP